MEGRHEQVVNGVGDEELQRDSISVEDVTIGPTLNQLPMSKESECQISTCQRTAASLDNTEVGIRATLVRS